MAIEVDGHALLDVTDIRLHFPVDGRPACDVRLLLTEEFTFDEQGDLHLHLHLQEGDMMTELTAPGDTQRKFVVTRRQP